MNIIMRDVSTIYPNFLIDLMAMCPTWLVELSPSGGIIVRKRLSAAVSGWSVRCVDDFQDL